MRTMVREINFAVDGIVTSSELGELAKIGAKFGYRVVIEPEDSTSSQDGNQVRFVRNVNQWATETLIDLAIVLAFAGGLSGEQMIKQLRGGFATRQFPMDKPIQDAMSVGGPTTAPLADDFDPDN